MASMKQNMALLRQCPTLKNIKEKLTAFGEKRGAPIGVISVEEGGPDRIYVKLVMRSEASVRQLDASRTEVRTPVRKDEVIDFMIRITDRVQKLGYLEVYKGGASQLNSIGTFLSGDLKTSIQADVINIENLVGLHDALTAAVGAEAAIKGASVANYKHDEEVVGSFSPRFSATSDAIGFIAGLGSLTEEGGPRLRRLTLAWKYDKKKIRLSVTPDSCYSLSCHPDNEEYARNIVRRIAGVPTLDNTTPPAEAAE